MHTKNLKAWAKTSLHEQIQNRITKIDWAAVAGVQNVDGQNVRAEQLNEGIRLSRGRGINLSQFWGSFR